MYMFCSKLGELEVEIEFYMEDPKNSRITGGYKVDTFQDLDEQEIDYLNETYREEIFYLIRDVVRKDDYDSLRLRH